MRRLIAIEFLSVDGVMQGLGSPDEDRDGGFAHGGWGAPYAGAIDFSGNGGGLADTSAYLFGRKTYEKMADYWPSVPVDNPIAAHMNATTKYVVTNTVTSSEWSKTVLLAGEVTDSVGRLKQSGNGDVAILGSGALVRSLFRADMIDGLRLFVHPLVLGSGKRLLDGTGSPRPLTLTGVSTTPLGTVALSYDVERR